MAADDATRPESGRRRALVTGGNRGIGRACAAALLRDGRDVVVAGRDRDALQRVVEELQPLGSIEAVELDVTDPDAVEEVVMAAAVDILVANAGTDLSQSIARTTLADWGRLMAVNATGAFLSIRAALPRMQRQRWGRVVVVDSVAGRMGLRYGSAYAASKHAALGLVRSVALEVASKGVTVNAICPAFVATEMADRVAEAIAASTDRSAEEARASLEQFSPLRRLIDPDECGAAVAFLASDGASAVNGQSLVVDGGSIQR